VSTFRRSRTDGQHKECIRAARKLFPCVVDTHEVGGFVDFVCSGPSGLWFVEVKDGTKRPFSDRHLTAAERNFASHFWHKARHVVVGCERCVANLVRASANDENAWSSYPCGHCFVNGPAMAVSYEARIT
jgi:hypothetical protein